MTLIRTISVLFNVVPPIVLRIAKLTDYALLIATAMAEQPERRFSASELAAEVHLEPPTVSKVLKLLAKAGAIRSFRGAQGGYQMDHSPEKVSVADIIVAIEGPIGMTECSQHKGLCSQESRCRLRRHWRRISGAVGDALGAITLADMLQPDLPMPTLAKIEVSALSSKKSL